MPSPSNYRSLSKIIIHVLCFYATHHTDAAQHALTAALDDEKTVATKQTIYELVLPNGQSLLVCESLLRQCSYFTPMLGNGGCKIPIPLYIQHLENSFDAIGLRELCTILDKAAQGEQFLLNHFMSEDYYRYWKILAQVLTIADYLGNRYLYSFLVKFVSYKMVDSPLQVSFTGKGIPEAIQKDMGLYFLDTKVFGDFLERYEPRGNFSHIGSKAIGNITWLPDNTHVAYYCDGAQIRNSVTGAVLYEYTNPTSENLELGVKMWSPDGTKFAYGLHNITVYDKTRYVSYVLGRVHGQNSTIVSLEWSPDSTKLIASFDDGTVKLWDVTTQTLLHEFVADGEYAFWVGAWAPNNGTLVLTSLCSRMIRIYDVVRGTELPVTLTATMPEIDGIPQAPITQVVWSPDSAKLALCLPAQERIEIWDMTAHTLSCSAQSDGTIAVWSPDSTKLAHLCNKMFLIWDMTRRGAVESIAYAGAPKEVGLPFAAWSPDGMLFACILVHKYISIWDTATWALLRRFPFDKANQVVWSPDGTKIIASSSVSSGTTIRTWDISRDVTQLTFEQIDFLHGAIQREADKRRYREMDIYQSLPEVWKQMLVTSEGFAYPRQ